MVYGAAEFPRDVIVIGSFLVEPLERLVADKTRGCIIETCQLFIVEHRLRNRFFFVTPYNRWRMID